MEKLAIYLIYEGSLETHRPPQFQVVHSRLDIHHR